jgi:endonuclease YncB( thermonuclease family)
MIVRVVCLVLILLIPSLAFADFSALVVSVLDGDTLDVLHKQHPERIRLTEKGQPYGHQAKQATAAMVFGKEVLLQTHGRDRSGRTLADVRLPDGTHVNHTLVKNGWCWWYRKYAPGDTELEKLEKEAREAKKGL